MWIETIGLDKAGGRLKQIYERIKGPDGQIDNILQVHSLRPHTLEGHMALYKGVLHHPRNSLPKWQLEMLGVYVSLLNGCAYCVAHHYAGLRRLLDDDEWATELRDALQADAPERALGGALLATARYARALTCSPAEIDEAPVAAMRREGLDDGQILEVNQVVSYFAYANRTVLGLGVATAGEDLGLSPSDEGDAGNWGHR